MVCEIELNVLMKNDINTFLNIMEDMLSYDMIKYIISMIYRERNFHIIRKQKFLKNKVNTDVIKIHNIYYYDNNFMIYKNQRDQFVLEKISLNPVNNISLYANDNPILTSNNCENEIILFDNNQEQVYDDNGLPVQRRIKLNIVYV